MFSGAVRSYNLFSLSFQVRFSNFCRFTEFLNSLFCSIFRFTEFWTQIDLIQQVSHNFKIFLINTLWNCIALWTNSNLAINQGKLFCIIFLKKKLSLNPFYQPFRWWPIPPNPKEGPFEKKWIFWKKLLIPMIYNTLVKCLRKRVKKFKIHSFWGKWPNV